MACGWHICFAGFGASKRMTREMQIYNSIVTYIGSMSSCASCATLCLVYSLGFVPIGRVGSKTTLRPVPSVFMILALLHGLC
jgi:hypothetical protein